MHQFLSIQTPITTFVYHASSIDNCVDKTKYTTFRIGLWTSRIMMVCICTFCYIFDCLLLIDGYLTMYLTEHVAKVFMNYSSCKQKLWKMLCYSFIYLGNIILYSSQIFDLNLCLKLDVLLTSIEMQFTV